MKSLGIGIIGSGGIALANHIPGFAQCPDTQVVALCDANPDVLAKAAQATGIAATFADYNQLLAHDGVDAVVIATPNDLHAPIAIAAAKAGKHVLCEKPIAMDFDEALRMLQAVDAAKVRHMTAFTYRFVPAMRYIAHLVHSGQLGQPYHFRAQRFQDWGDRYLGWRQSRKRAATGELGDMLSHRIDFGHYLLGPVKRVVGHTKRLINQRGGQVADVEDWVACIADFQIGATGVLESTKLASGRGEGGKSRDYCEVNGSEGSAIYLLEDPNHVQVGTRGEAGMRLVPVPEEFLKHPYSRRDARAGEPGVVFRYDQDAEFVQAIRENRPCRPSFVDGARCQAVMDAIVKSETESKWVEVRQP